MSTMSWPAKLAVAALLAVAPLAAPAPVAARVAAAPASDPLADATEVSEIMFGVIDFRTLLTKSIKDEMAGDPTFNLRPEWPGLLTEAVVEEFDHDRPALIGLFARQMVKNFTGEELRQGVIMMRDPEAQRLFAAGAAGQTELGRTPKFGKEFTRAANTAAGTSFMTKLGRLDTMMGSMENDFIVELLPGMLRRFGEKAEAAEARRGG
jgi:hypothetical protein